MGSLTRKKRDYREDSFGSRPEMILLARYCAKDPYLWKKVARVIQKINTWSNSITKAPKSNQGQYAVTCLLNNVNNRIPLWIRLYITYYYKGITEESHLMEYLDIDMVPSGYYSTIIKMEEFEKREKIKR